jgi:hypothetical protein
VAAFAVGATVARLGAGYPDPAPASRPTPAFNPIFNPDLTIKKHTQTPNDLNAWLRRVTLHELDERLAHRGGIDGAVRANDAEPDCRSARLNSCRAAPALRGRPVAGLPRS